MRKLLFAVVFKRLLKRLYGKGFAISPLGKSHLLKFISSSLYRYLKPVKGIALIEVQGSKMYVNADKPLGDCCDCLIRGSYETYVTGLFRKTVKEGDVVVDIGAHVGYYTLLAAKLVGGRGKVFDFEPGPDNYALLTANIKVNGYDNVVAVRKAVSDKSGITKLFLSTTSSGEHTICPLESNSNYIMVETTALDEFFRDKTAPIDVIKIDAEGAEMTILLGMDRIIRENENLKMFIEFFPSHLVASGFSPKQFLDKLIEHDFKFHTIGKSVKYVDASKVEGIKAYANLFLHRRA